MMKPNDHMSLFVVYFYPFKIYGLMYNGVPTYDTKSYQLKLSTALANPKSYLLG